jgi:hypothetical protein
MVSSSFGLLQLNEDRADEEYREEEGLVTREQYVYTPSSPPLSSLSLSKRDMVKRKSKQWHQFRISQTEIVNPISSDKTSPPEIFHIPLEPSKTKVDLFTIDFPVSLRGYVSACFYVEVVSTLNRYRERLGKGGMWQKLKYAKVFKTFLHSLSFLFSSFGFTWTLLPSLYILSPSHPTCPLYNTIRQIFCQVANYLDVVNSYSKNIKWCLQKVEGSDFRVTIEVHRSRRSYPVNFTAVQTYLCVFLPHFGFTFF